MINTEIVLWAPLRFWHGATRGLNPALRSKFTATAKKYRETFSVMLKICKHNRKCFPVFVGLGPSLQNIVRFIVRLSLAYRKIDLQ